MSGRIGELQVNLGLVRSLAYIFTTECLPQMLHLLYCCFCGKRSWKKRWTKIWFFN